MRAGYVRMPLRDCKHSVLLLKRSKKGHMTPGKLSRHHTSRKQKGSL